MALRIKPGTRKARVALVLAVAAIASAAVFGYKPLRFYYAMKRGKQLLAARRLDAALEQFQSARELRPQSPAPHFYLARTYRKLGRMGRVQKHIQRAFDLGYDVRTLDREQWLAQAQTGQMRLAEPHLKELLARPGEDGPEILEAYVAGYIRLQRLGKAELLINGWKDEFKDDPQPHYFEALILVAYGNDMAALAPLEHALMLDASRTDIRLELANALVRLQKYERAESHFRACLKAEPDNARALLGLADCLVPRERAGEAKALYERILKTDPDHASARVGLAKIAVADGRPKPAIELLEPIVAKNERNASLRQTYASALRATGRVDEAKQHMQFVTESRKARSRIHILLDELKEDPGRVEKRYEIGELLMKYGSRGEAILWLLAVLEYQPRHQGANRLLARYYESKGLTETASKFRSRVEDPLKRGE